MLAVDDGRERILSVWQWQWGHLLGKVAVSTDIRHQNTAFNHNFSVNSPKCKIIQFTCTFELPKTTMKQVTKLRTSSYQRHLVAFGRTYIL